MMRVQNMIRTIGWIGCLLLLSTGCRSDPPARETLLIAGNAAMTRYLKPVVQEFMVRHPRASVICEPGGTTAAVIALKRGAIDIAALSRLVSAEEDDPYLRDYQVCRDGIAVVMNPANPLDSLAMEQLEDIFDGTVTSWKQVGGLDAPITLYVRDKASASSRSFNEMILGGDDPVRGAKTVASASEMLEAIKKDANAIGYMTLRRLSKDVKTAKIKGIELSRLTMLSGRYPLSRTFYLGLYMKPSRLAEEFVQFTLSKEGQEILAQGGLLPVH